MLKAKEVSLHYAHPVLKEVNFNIGNGEIVGIVGRSGAGKTSLLKILSGLESPSSGEVTFEGKRLKGPHEKLIPGHDEIRLVNQDFKLDIYHTVEENIRESILHLPYHERDQLVEKLLQLMQLMLIRDQKAHLISGGEQQRLAIARALATEPKLLLLDEPFAHLDAHLKNRINQYLHVLQKKKQMSIVLVSHYGAELLSMVDKIYFLKNGKLIPKGSPKKVYYNVKLLSEARFFGPVNSIKIKDKTIRFRPDEFEIAADTASDSILVEYVGSAFNGMVYENFFRTSENEALTLYAQNELKNVRAIKIYRKHT